jgi:hypothetical protein
VLEAVPMVTVVCAKTGDEQQKMISPVITGNIFLKIAGLNKNF